MAALLRRTPLLGHRQLVVAVWAGGGGRVAAGGSLPVVHEAAVLRALRV